MDSRLSIPTSTNNPFPIELMVFPSTNISLHHGEPGSSNILSNTETEVLLYLQRTPIDTFV